MLLNSWKEKIWNYEKKWKGILNLHLKKALTSNNFVDEHYQTAIKRKMSIFYVLFQNIGKWLKVS